ncbi:MULTISPECIES: ABC transporter permease [Turicibacter]|uniref:ABC transporter permease subunit n=2 Tax=Turicibacter sanguinis TaxID=154288 RepID=A0A173RG34_9FIRM|nr:MULTISPECIES: ABC transporter permease [Turicibacter]EFF62503.1 putative glutathione ABC transporter, permease protein GsiC [Turicibacter sanguinis PC909]EGC90779.1 putative oligopeptide transport system permease protein OppB [Turicibacter sp. HGF1]MBP3904755.1 ABC transporter permease [Turicibacter sp.]MCU7192703.1 ABC transporter permease [Turicibacter sanguinis]MCU7195376.1 ABC transporter permease [Turicibacter sanguinis]
MWKYVLKRLAISVVTIFLILLFLFLMLELMPGSPFNDEKLTESQLALLNAKYGLDQPIFTRFFNYLKLVILDGDFGVSYAIQKDVPVSTLISGRVMITIRIGLQAIVLGTIIGLCLGLVAALKRNTWIDSTATVISVIGVSVPSYVFALGLCFYLGYKLKMFPITYNMSKPMISSILPTIALSMFVIANVARFLRSEMVDVLKSDYMLLVEAKGVKKMHLVFKHGLRNALIPVITVVAPLMVSLMTGSLVVEKIFAIPGMGSLLVTAIQVNDYNVVIALSFIYSILFIGVMLVVDILYGVIDPRIRLSKEGGSHES